MTYPKVSIFWINYNSKNIINIVLESLYSLFELNYPNYEVIIVDNGSIDGSFDIIRQTIESRRHGNVYVRLIKLNRNRGFNAANNIAFQARDKNAKYVVLLNNDAVPAQDSLLNLVEVMEAEKENRIAAAQGIITTWDGTKVDNMGFIVDELLFAHALYRGHDPYSIKRPHYCTFASGAYSIYLIDSILKVNRREILFDNHMFAYYDDKVLGLKLWDHMYKVKAFPFIAARHYGSASFGYLTIPKLYLTTRNFLVLCKVVDNFRYKPLASILFPLRRAFEILVKSKKMKRKEIFERFYVLLRALLQAKNCFSLINYRIDLSNVPLMKLNIIEALVTLVSKLED